MAYVRQRGKQLAIVHGARDPETRKVEQQILFTLYSKSEALEALGKKEPTNAERFRMILESSHPTIRFDWKKLRRDIEANLEILPDTYDYRSTRFRGRFREDLTRFAKQLILVEPGKTPSSSQLLSEHRQELEYLRELIVWRLDSPKEQVDRWDEDDDFFWRFAARDSQVPSDIEEQAAGYYERREHGRAAVAFRLLTDAFEDYADGHNYLGLIALDQGHLDEAIGHFEKTMEVGRRLFPKRISRDRWWSDHSTRPYIRGLQNLALALNQAKRYDDALAACERLQHECQDDITAAAHRASVYLNTSRWQSALDAALYIHEISPGEGVVAALAAFQLGRPDDARVWFLHAALNKPRTVAMVVGAKFPRPTNHDEAEDHNMGVTLVRALSGHLEKRSPASQRFFADLWRSDQVTRCRKELEDVTRRWHEDRKNRDRVAYDRMMRMRTVDFARETAGASPRRASQMPRLPAPPAGRSKV
jgi:tetratricopeptide (TPR) repeat protein